MAEKEEKQRKEQRKVRRRGVKHAILPAAVHTPDQCPLYLMSDTLGLPDWLVNLELVDTSKRNIFSRTSHIHFPSSPTPRLFW